MPPRGRRKADKQNGPSDSGRPAESGLNPQERDELLKDLEELEGDVFKVQIPDRIESTKNVARVMITHIDVTDFKSYSGTQVIGPFHHALNGIVGPNGSGKSNVIDSLLFVFGFRSNKIRAAKLSSFIHKSAKKSPTSCTVTVNFVQYLRDPIRVLSRFAVSRTVDQNNKSKYMLDGKTAQFKDIFKKLKDAGVDLDHNRFLILQGEVEQISLMKCKAEKEGDEGMLEYLDDIIGSSRYIKPLKLFTLKLELVTEKRESQVNRVNLVENERLNMVGPELLLKIKEQKKTISKHQKEVEKQKTSIAVIQEHLNSENLRFQKCENEIKKTMTKKSEKEKEISKEEKKVVNLAEKPQKNSEEIEKLQTELEEVKNILEEKVPELNSLLSECQKKTTKLNNERDKIGADLAEKKKVENEKNAALTLAQSKKIQMTDEADRLDSRLNNAKRSVEELQEKIEAKENEKTAVEASIPRIEKELHEAESRLSKLKEQYPRIQTKYEDLRQRYEAALTEKNNDEKRSKVMSMLMREKRTGNIPGIVGRLGSLGTIDKKYDVAISTNFGQLDMIVCDSQDTVKKCLAFVHEKKLERTQFVAVDTLKKNKIDEKMDAIDTPENLPRLFDLVNPVNDDAKMVFYSVLGNTLVAKDIHEAHKASRTWSKQRFNVVTLNGEFVSTSGALTGGGNVQRRGLIGTDLNSVTNKEDPEKLKLDLGKAREEYEQLKAELDGAESRLKSLNEKLLQMKNNKKKTDDNLNLIKDQLNSAKKNVAEFEKQKEKVKIDEKALGKINEEIKQMEEERNSATTVVDEIQKEFDEISKNIEKIYEEISGDIQKEVDERKKRKTEIENEIKTLRSSASKAEMDLRKGNERIEAAKEAIVEMEEKLVNLESEKKKCEEDLVDLRTSLEEKEKQMTEVRGQLDEVQADNDGVDEREVSLKKEITEAKEKYEEIKEEIKSVIAKKEDVDSKITKLKVYNIKEILADRALKRDGKKISKEKKQKKKRSEDKDDDVFYPSSESESDPESEEEEVHEDPEVSEDPNDPNCGVLPKYTEDEIREFKQDELVAELGTLEQERAAGEKTMNVGLIEEYRAKMNACMEQLAVLDEITIERDRVRSAYFDLKRQQVEEFMEGFNEIALSLREQYQKLTLGGDAELELVDQLDPYSEGVIFRVRPRGKGWRPIHQTSGGEKTLSSLALVFALHDYRPTPFYVMDEIDAALDARNVMLIAQFVKERAETAQFIIISLREQMFNLSHRLIGIYKIKDCTHNVPIYCRELEEGKDIVFEDKLGKENQENPDILERGTKRPKRIDGDMSPASKPREKRTRSHN
ncbi:hypothetical protein FO519_008470 [Halicephalobus sp. NKZ332]|nr:hypothetical protein FO519_008470 [Halicephalobus sp. NKZ332]